jgi:hypothetical protein
MNNSITDSPIRKKKNTLSIIIFCKQEKITKYIPASSTHFLRRQSARCEANSHRKQDPLRDSLSGDKAGSLAAAITKLQISSSGNALSPRPDSRFNRPIRGTITFPQGEGKQEECL